MIRHKIVSLVVAFGFLSTSSVLAQSGVVTGLYQIISGTFIECCSILGEVRSSLPTDHQTFISLAVDPQSNMCTMTFLGKDMQTVSSVWLCPTNLARFDFSNGLVFSDHFVFHVDPGPPPYGLYWDYTASNSIDGLRISGTLGAAEMLCIDAPDRFVHTNVVAVRIPEPTIRVSEVEICWNSVSNKVYQAQYRSAITTNTWIDLGSPQVGNGSTNCITDKVVAGEPRRFYRIVNVP